MEAIINLSGIMSKQLTCVYNLFLKLDI